MSVADLRILPSHPQQTMLRYLLQLAFHGLSYVLLSSSPPNHSVAGAASMVRGIVLVTCLVTSSLVCSVIKIEKNWYYILATILLTYMIGIVIFFLLQRVTNNIFELVVIAHTRKDFLSLIISPYLISSFIVLFPFHWIVESFIRGRA